PGHALLLRPGRRKRPADLRCRRAAVAGLCGAASVRVLDGSFRQPFHCLSVARKHQGPGFRERCRVPGESSSPTGGTSNFFKTTPRNVTFIIGFFSFTLGIVCRSLDAIVGGDEAVAG